MSRAIRAALAKDTLTILAQGSYVLPDGRIVSVADDIRDCVGCTRVLQAEHLQALASQTSTDPQTMLPGTLEIENETTLAGISKLLQAGCAPVAALNSHRPAIRAAAS